MTDVSVRPSYRWFLSEHEDAHCGCLPPARSETSGGLTPVARSLFRQCSVHEFLSTALRPGFKYVDTSIPDMGILALCFGACFPPSVGLRFQTNVSRMIILDGIPTAASCSASIQKDAAKNIFILSEKAISSNN